MTEMYEVTVQMSAAAGNYFNDNDETGNLGCCKKQTIRILLLQNIKNFLGS